MAREYAFKLVNVFAEQHFGGNPLAVFPQAEGLSDDEMQLIAKQFNLSETVFIFPSDTAVADLRIFTPFYELPLAGHPTIGAACVLQQQHNLSERFTLNTHAKPVQIRAENGYAEMAVQGFTIKSSLASRDQLAKVTGLTAQQIAPTAYWLNSGTGQLLLQLKGRDALQQLNIDGHLLERICTADQGLSVLYVWYEDAQTENIYARCFYTDKGTVLEDSGTGSACANLGAYYLSVGRYPLTRKIFQGDEMGRPNRLSLKLDQQQVIRVGGQVIEVGEGMFRLPE